MNIKPVSTAFILLTAIFAHGCASYQYSPAGQGSGSLERWVDMQLTPYLAKELADNPRFEGASIQLVKLQGQEIVPEIDGLSDDMRARIFDRLITTAGVNLDWRPAVREWSHHRSLADVDCGLQTQTTHYVGLELREAATGGERVAVRALDVRENQWVSGFGLNWAGQLSGPERNATTNAAADPFLRGLRPLPFTPDQADLTTSYLANNLSCLIRESASERLTVHVRTPDKSSPEFFHTVAQILGRYINSFQEIELVGSPKAADAIINSEIVQINDKLWQVWVGVEFQEDKRRLSGADTPAYVALDAAGASVASTPRKPDQNSSSDESVPGASTPPGIDQFYGIVPNDYSNCATGEVWGKGERLIGAGEQLPANGCFAVAAKATGYASYLIAQDAGGEWFRLANSSCQSPQFTDARALASKGEWRFPDRSVIKFSGKGWKESFYLVAAGSAVAAEAVQQVINKLPDRCTANRGIRRSPLDGLSSVLKQYPGDAIWRKLEILHAPAG